jgi:hypothetical protein
MPNAVPIKEPEEWMPKDRAAKLLGASVRQLERRAQQGYIEKKLGERAPTERNAPVFYSRADILAIKAGKPNVYAREVPAAKTEQRAASVPENGNALARVAPPQTPLDWAFIVESARQYALPAPKPWLTLDEAVAFSGLSRAYLLRRAREGWAAAVDQSFGGARSSWRFNRDKLSE